MGALAILIFCSAGTHVPVERRAPDFVHEVRGALPPAFWGYWVVILFSVAIEFCMIGWGAEFLNSAVGRERSTASTSMTLFFVAMVLGRLAGSRLARRTEARRLLVVAFGIVAGGFPLFWLSASPLAALTGLAVTGLGIGNLFPLTLAVAVGVAQGHTDVASARVTLGAGLAILTAPLALGRFADEIGIADAYGVTLLLIVGGLAMVLLTNRLETRLTPGARSVGDGRVRRPRP
ncbi:MAG TPA: MFS transporter [Herpetosiphonaceae bacterium]|nr:MFS transporter [Herpetosiphonaceae bacterium]